MSSDLNNYSEEKPRFVLRIVWRIINATLFRVLIGVRLHVLRNSLLRLFGARVPNHAMIYPSCKIFAPWNLEVGEYTTIGPNTEVYNKDLIVIGRNSVISQGSFLCTASHDITNILMPLKTRPIYIKDRVWLAADVFLGPGVRIGEGAVVAARSVVFREVEEWTVVGGNPATFIKKRTIK
jgi:putative colanic acid biosynthesis acetyltransferase WcaF